MLGFALRHAVVQTPSHPTVSSLHYGMARGRAGTAHMHMLEHAIDKHVTATSLGVEWDYF